MITETDLKKIQDTSLFNFWSSDSVRYADLDPNNHVNNVVILSYIENARLGIRSAILDKLDNAAQKMSWVVVAQSIAYFRPIHYPAEVEVGCFVSDLGRTSFQLAYGVFIDSICHASATSRSVCVDPITGRAVALTNAFRSSVREFHCVIT